MSSNAVLPGAPPAASTQELDLAEPHSQIAPTSEKYRLTGELPSDDDKSRTEALADRSERTTEKDKPVKEDASAAPDAEHAQKKTVTKPEAESRWQKRERELKEAREEIARLKSSRQEPQRETEQAKPQPAAETKTKGRPEPKVDDVDPKTGKPLYPDYNAYSKDLRKWDREEALREFHETSAIQTQEQQRAQTEQEFQRAASAAYAKVSKTYADYDATVTAVINAKEADGRSPIYYEANSPIDQFLRRQPDVGMPLMYHLAKNINDPAVKEIFARTPDGTRYALTNVDQIARLAVIAHTFASKTAKPAAVEAGDGEGDDDTSAKPISAAPRPPHQTSGKGTVGKDPIAEAVEQGGIEGTDRYLKEGNARDPRLLEIRRRRQGK